jgi:hypothetical protein
MYVVLDTNVWITEMGLNSGRGAAVRFFINQQSATLAISQVIRQETEIHLRNDLKSFIEAISKNHSKLLSVFGKLKEVVLPSDNEVETVVNSVFSNLGVPVIEIPFSLESAQLSYEKILKKDPPSQKSQQFKDGVIWCDCLKLLDTNDVHLVTKDRAFYKNLDVKQGLAPELAAEAHEKPYGLHIYPELSELLESISVEVDVNRDNLLAAFLKENQESVVRMLKRFSFTFGEISSFKVQLFATGTPTALHLEFEYEIRCDPLESDGRSNAALILKGDADYDPQTNCFSNLRNFGEQFSYISAEGTEETSANHVLFANSIVLGHREIERSVRHKL